LISQLTQLSTEQFNAVR